MYQELYEDNPGRIKVVHVILADWFSGARQENLP